ncbi:MAG: SLC13 family permease [Bacteroidales bacterium]
MELGIAIAIIIVGLILLNRETFRPGTVLFSILTLLVVTDVISIDDAFMGFSNKVTIVIMLLFIVGEGISRSGMFLLLSKITLFDRKIPLPRMILRLMLPISMLATLVNSVTVVAIFLPFIKRMAEKFNISSQKFLIPLSYAAILGGATTMLGSTSNLVVNGLLIGQNMETLNIFEPMKLCSILAIVGILYVSIVGNRFLPGEFVDKKKLDQSAFRDYYIEVLIPEGSGLIGEYIEKRSHPLLRDFKVVQISRDNKKIKTYNAPLKLAKGDVLALAGNSQCVTTAISMPDIQVCGWDEISKLGKTEDLTQVEVVLSPRFPGIGQTVSTYGFAEKFRSKVLAIHRNGKRFSNFELDSVEMKEGDNIIMLANMKFAKNLGESKNFYLTSESTEIENQSINIRKIISILITVIVMVVGTLLLQSRNDVSGIDAMLYFVVFAVVSMVVSGLIPLFQFTKFVRWDVLIAIASAFGISTAIEESGLASIIADSLAIMSKPIGPYGMLVIIYLVTSLLTELITNNVAVAISFPIAINVAENLNVDPKAFIMAICVSASLGFVTPLGSQANLITQNLGSYKYGDFVRIGLPLQILLGGIAIVLIPVFWSF